MLDWSAIPCTSVKALHQVTSQGLPKLCRIFVIVRQSAVHSLCRIFFLIVSWLQYDDGAEPAEDGFVGIVSVWSYSSKLKAALLAEFIGMMIFQIYGGNAPDSVAAFGNGITLVVLGKSRATDLHSPSAFGYFKPSTTSMHLQNQNPSNHYVSVVLILLY